MFSERNAKIHGDSTHNKTSERKKAFTEENAEETKEHSILNNKQFVTHDDNEAINNDSKG